MEFNLFLPQMRMSFDRLVEAARVAEAAGFIGLTGMDHLVPPGADDQPMYEAMIVNSWLAAHTSTLKLGSLVLCDALRHPAVLARQAVSLDHASGGRYELGIGWGSYANDFTMFGIEPDKPRERVARLRETLELMTRLWAGETIDFAGEYFRFSGAAQAPGPLTRVPLVIGGAGPKTLALVRDYADWWNIDVRRFNEFDREGFAELRAQVGSARVSIQEMIAFVPSGGDKGAIAEQAQRRFGRSTPVVGTAGDLLEHFGRRAEQGVERVYIWFTDFAPTSTIEQFGADVIGPLSR